jgi:hypothetical protein
LRASFDGNVEILDAFPSSQHAWQWHCPLMSLPKAFQTTVDHVPATVPYLTPNPALVKKWQTRLAGVADQCLTVGLCWAGAKGLKEDAKRSMTLTRLAPLLEARGITFVSLQKSDAASQLEQTPEVANLRDWTGELHDFSDTAALISQLDLVISVDTAIAHLAGALGKPVWLLNRFQSEWRWLRDREDSPWYPSLRLFTQTTAGDWSEVITRVLAALRTVSSQSPHSTT